jgi:hypothetical protein
MEYAGYIQSVPSDSVELNILFTVLGQRGLVHDKRKKSEQEISRQYSAYARHQHAAMRQNIL